MNCPEADAVHAIIKSYDKPIARAYCRVRFQILRQRFLEEIGQYLPKEGRVVDIGCGFGLFGLYFAMTRPRLSIIGIDKQAARVQMAQAAALRLKVTNARFSVGDAEAYSQSHPIRAAYMLDIIHHIDRDAARVLIATLADALEPGGRLIVKDIETKPTYKRWFTLALDKMMDWSARVDYWHQTDMVEMLASEGLEVFRHSMVDYLPYPHVIYIATKPLAVSRSSEYLPLHRTTVEAATAVAAG